MTAGLLMFAPTAASAARNACNPCGPCEPCNPCGPCDWNFCDMEFDIGVDFLWWKPCIDDLEFAAVIQHPGSDSRNQRIHYHNVDLDWEPGVRIWAFFPNFYCDWALGASYTFIEPNSSTTVHHRNHVTSPLVHIGVEETEVTTSTSELWDKAKGDFDLTYHEWDIGVAYDISCNQCHKFMPFIGIAGIVLDQDLKVTLHENGDKDHIKWESDYWGVGLRAGSCYKYRINECFSFIAKAHATILAGSVDSNNKQLQFAEDVRIKDDETCHVVPGYHIGAGFEYDTCWCNWDFSARVGYEFLVWHNVPNHRVFTNSEEHHDGLASHATSASVRTLAFHGLFAGLGVSF